MLKICIILMSIFSQNIFSMNEPESVQYEPDLDRMRLELKEKRLKLEKQTRQMIIPLKLVKKDMMVSFEKKNQ